MLYRFWYVTGLTSGNLRCVMRCDAAEAPPPPPAELTRLCPLLELAHTSKFASANKLKHARLARANESPSKGRRASTSESQPRPKRADQ